jgi:alpha-tubulin suppressor-like RCC1 family protein
VTGATDIAAGRSTSAGNQPSSCAVVAGGAVRCWGDNNNGQLGNNSRDSSNAPVEVTGLTGARSVVVGAVHACALLTDGTVRCWGSGSAGAVGPNGTDWTMTPVAVPGLADVRAITAGDAFTCALLATGAVQCWGRGGSGELGRGTIPGIGMDQLPTPAPVASLAGVTQLAAGAQHACAFSTNGLTRCWGSNFVGQLGVGDQPPVPDRAAGPVAVLW